MPIFAFGRYSRKWLKSDTQSGSWFWTHSSGSGGKVVPAVPSTPFSSFTESFKIFFKLFIAFKKEYFTFIELLFCNSILEMKLTPKIFFFQTKILYQEETKRNLLFDNISKYVFNGPFGTLVFCSSVDWSAPYIFISWVRIPITPPVFS